VKAEATAVILEPLVHKAGRDSIGAKHGDEEMALGMVEACSVFEDFGCQARNQIQIVISRMRDAVADPLEAGASS
jgi:hypothetical protein